MYGDKWQRFEIGDTLFLNSVKNGKKQLIVVDKIEPNEDHAVRLGMFTTWDHEIYITSIQLSPNSKIRKRIATPLLRGLRTHLTRYVIIDESLSSEQRILPHRILEEDVVAPYFGFQGGDRYRVAKVGSVYDWGLEELLTHTHKEVRALAIDWMAGKTWAPNAPQLP